MTAPREIDVVAVHGNGGGSSRFARIDTLGDPTMSFHAVTLPGFGESTRDKDLHTVADYADHLATMLPAGRDVVIVGHGIGGSIALDLASRRPETMTGLVLHAPVGARLDSRWFPKLMATESVRSLAKRIIAARPVRPILHRVFFPDGVPEPHRTAFFEGYRRCDAFSQMFDIITVDWFEGLAPIRDVPVRLLWGAGDRVLDAAHTEQFVAKAPGATVEIIDGWDHFPMLEQPDEYAAAIARIARELIDG